MRNQTLVGRVALVLHPSYALKCTPAVNTQLYVC